MKAVLVTGANSGIGYYSARRLAANGFYVYAGIRKESNMIRFDGIDNIQSIKLDVTSQNEIDAAAQFIQEENRGLYGIVNNAGITTFSTMNEIEEDELYRIFNTNVLGPYRINKTLSPMLIASGGRTVTIGSISGYLASAGNGAYAMSKFAMEGYTDTYAQEMDELGVHVSIIEPGGYNTNILRNVDAESLSSEVKHSIQRKLASFDKTHKDPHEVAAAVLDVMSSNNPKRRYMIVPNENQAKRTVSIALKKAIELNHQQEYEYTQDELIKMLVQLLDESSSE